MQTFINVKKVNDETLNSLKVNVKNPLTVFYAPPVTYTIWIIISSAFGGCLVLISIAWAMNKAGFFRRKKKEELKRIIRESRIVSLRDIEKILAEFDRERAPRSNKNSLESEN